MAANQNNNRPTAPRNVARYLVELLVYAGFVGAYYFAVLHFCGGWLKELFDHQKAWYAVASLGIIIAQSALLELVTVVLGRISGRKPR
jgi:NADH:ubiquinone oxidoreductase subunit 6 (subunit J)